MDIDGTDERLWVSRRINTRSLSYCELMHVAGSPGARCLVSAANIRHLAWYVLAERSGKDRVERLDRDC